MAKSRDISVILVKILALFGLLYSPCIKKKRSREWEGSSKNPSALELI
jgi:hypothetical protein